MKGICSSTPGQAAIRLLVGTHLLLLVQCWLVLYSRAELDGMLRIVVGLTATLGLFSLALAVHGGPAGSGEVWHPRPRQRRSALGARR